MENSPRYTTLIWKTFRGQYRIFYDVIVDEKGVYKLTFPNFKYGSAFYTYAIQDVINRDPENKYFYSYNDGDTKLIGFKKEHRKIIFPMSDLLYESFNWIHKNYIEPFMYFFTDFN